MVAALEEMLSLLTQIIYTSQTKMDYANSKYNYVTLEISSSIDILSLCVCVSLYCLECFNKS